MQHHELIIHPDWDEQTHTLTSENTLNLSAITAEPQPEENVYHLADEMIAEMAELTQYYPKALAQGELSHYMHQIHNMHIKWLKKLHQLSLESEQVQSIDPLIDALQTFTNQLNHSLTMLKPTPHKTH